MTLANWTSLIIWSVGVLITLGLTWGWARSKLLQHDKEIASGVKSMESFKKENMADHKEIVDKISQNRDTISGQYAEITRFMGRVEAKLEALKPDERSKS